MQASVLIRVNDGIMDFVDADARQSATEMTIRVSVWVGGVEGDEGTSSVDVSDVAESSPSSPTKSTTSSLK